MTSKNVQIGRYKTFARDWIFVCKHHISHSEETKQIFGTLMGSPVSPILANLVMEDIEHKAMSEFHHPPKVGKRYIDDTFVVIKREYLQQFFNFLNSIEPTVQFAKETESDGVLAFLDVKLTRENTGYLDYTVHRKPTHTDRYPNFRSDHSLQHKKAVIKTLLCRAEHLTSSEANYKE